MIVVSAGMEKSGTGWYFNLTNALLAATGGTDTRVLRQSNLVLKRLIRPHNCAVPELSGPRLGIIDVLTRRSQPFAVKTHRAPTPAVVARAGAERLRVTYCYRDLRDVALSALDHNQRVGDRSLGRITGVDCLADAVNFAAGLVPAWRQWMAVPGLHTVRYEDLCHDPAAEVRRLRRYLGEEHDESFGEELVAELLDRYPPGQGRDDWTDGLHFNQGRAGRFQELADPAADRLFDEVLGPHLETMGYR